MKSPMIMAADYIPADEKKNYSDVQVLKSGAGYYLGTLHQERDSAGNLLYEEPGSRDSDGYFPTPEAAAKALRAMEEALPGQDGLLRTPQSNLF